MSDDQYWVLLEIKKRFASSQRYLETPHPKCTPIAALALATAHCTYLRMQVLEKGNQSQEALLLPELWEPVCVGWGGEMMVWRGWQYAGPASAKGQPVYLQEWRVTLIGNAAREDHAASRWSPIE